ncbi:MAG: threonine--tRNA ligase [Candidatus Caenarcaniphilales bacterium]|nr:threonine--tRNA ligase [Candidatus Caenarcaniphilales bacterium]
MNQQATLIQIKLPDGSTREIPSGSSGMDLAKAISPSLAKKSIALDLNGQIKDLSTILNNNDEVKIICQGDGKSYDVLRHTTSHILAAVVQKKFPNAKVGIGPATENGFFYDFRIDDHKITDEDLVDIEKEMKKFASGAYEIIREEVKDADSKLAEYKAAGEIYKAELLEEHKNSNPTEYYFVDNNGAKIWSDHCAGPHLPNTKFIKSLKLTNVSGAYWRANQENDVMQRVYGTVWWTDEELEQYLKRKEEAEKRDHRKLARTMDLFSSHDIAGAGLIFWHPKLAVVRQELEDFWKKEHRKAGYDFVVTPHIAKSELWDISGHNSFYKDNMYSLKVDEQEYILKPMNCPFHVLIFKDSKHSYRNLPIRMAEMGTVYRNEASGAVHGLARVRGFTQDDAHIFCTREQYVQEIQGVYRLIDKIYSTLGLTFTVEVSTKPEKAIGADEIWDFAESGLKKALSELNVDYELNHGDGAFYGPKIDFKLKDALGRIWQGATIQLDFNLPERFKLEYTNDQNDTSQPVMIHRAIFGSMERISMVLIEHFAGAFPTWLSSEQVVVVPISDKHNDYAQKIAAELVEADVRAKTDLRAERMNYKIRDAQEKQIPYMLVVGDQEMASNSVSVRYRRGDNSVTMSISDFTDKIKAEIKSKALEGGV